MTYMKPSRTADREQWRLTIRRVELERFPDRIRPVLYFQQGGKLALNNINAKILIRHFGYNPDNWLWQQVHINKQIVGFAGHPVAALRVRVPEQVVRPWWQFWRAE